MKRTKCIACEGPHEWDTKIGGGDPMCADCLERIEEIRRLTWPKEIEALKEWHRKARWHSTAVSSALAPSLPSSATTPPR